MELVGSGRGELARKIFLRHCALALKHLDQMLGWLSAETLTVCAIMWRSSCCANQLGQTPLAVSQPMGRSVATNSRKTCTWTTLAGEDGGLRSRTEATASSGLMDLLR